MKKIDYVWNVVCIDGYWCFVECIWGVGFLDKNNLFQKKFEMFYFFIELKYFINVYFFWNFEEEGFFNLWQLFENLIFFEIYYKVLKLEYSVMMWNVFLLMYKEGIVQVYEEIVIEIEDKNEFFCGIMFKIYDMKIGLFCNEFIFLWQEKFGLFLIFI